MYCSVEFENKELPFIRTLKLMSVEEPRFQTKEAWGVGGDSFIVKLDGNIIWKRGIYEYSPEDKRSHLKEYTYTWLDLPTNHTYKAYSSVYLDKKYYWMDLDIVIQNKRVYKFEWKIVGTKYEGVCSVYGEA